MERFFKVSDRNLAVDHSLSQLSELAREGGCGDGGEKDSTDPRSELVTIVKIPQDKIVIIQGDFDREKHLSIGPALTEKKESGYRGQSCQNQGSRGQVQTTK